MRTTQLTIPALLISLASPTWAFSIHNVPHSGSNLFRPVVAFAQAEALNVGYTVGSGGRVVALRLENNGQQPLRCQAKFLHGRELLKRRVTTMEPGSIRTLAAPAWRTFSRVNIDVTCTKSRQ